MELRIYGVPIRYGLAPGGSRAVIWNFVNDIRNVEIDGFVQRIPDYDIKILLRGTKEHTDLVFDEIMSRFPDEGCQIETLRSISISSLRRNPSFQILNSSSRAKKSDQYPGKYDNISSKSSDQGKDSSLKTY